MVGGPWVPMFKPDPTAFVWVLPTWHSCWAASGIVLPCWVIWVSSNKPGSLCSDPMNLSLGFTWWLVSGWKVWTERCISRCVCHGDSGAWRQPLSASSSISSASGSASSRDSECLLSLLIQTALTMASAGAGMFPPEKARHQQGHHCKVHGWLSFWGSQSFHAEGRPCQIHQGGQVPNALHYLSLTHTHTYTHTCTHTFMHNYSFIQQILGPYNVPGIIYSRSWEYNNEHWDKIYLFMMWSSGLEKE